MCGYWNNYVETSTIVLRQCFCETSSNWCRDPVFMSRQHVCLVLVATIFLILSAFLTIRKNDFSYYKKVVAKLFILLAKFL